MECSETTPVTLCHAHLVGVCLDEVISVPWALKASYLHDQDGVEYEPR